GSYATVEQLRTGNPAELLAHDRAVRRRDPYGAHAVARHELVSVGVTLAGPPVSSLDVRDEADELRSWVRDNVEAYWAPWAGGAMGWNRVGLWALLPSGVEWGALGISRMLFTAVTGEVTSKSGAGAWALRHVDRAHHDVLEDALRIRDGGFVNPVGALDRRARLIAYMGDAIRQIRSTAMPR
ncbi:MAG TPA: aminoglycoside adenylyltransferase domain-containing protein, partial [Acidimicrobiales bacterium]|nr:aminoglycoside adenylyltransferase domain-containing protein [Acidimicrobiales bacterium]